jgi:hypothetical protein
MPDSLEISGNVFTAVIQLTRSLNAYVIDVHHAPEERLALSSQLGSLLNLLLILQNRMKESSSTDPWSDSIRALGIQNGPVDQLRSSLLKAVTKVGNMSGTSSKERLKWRFNKQEIENILQHVERIKSLVNLALTDDLR